MKDFAVQILVSDDGTPTVDQTWLFMGQPDGTLTANPAEKTLDVANAFFIDKIIEIADKRFGKTLEREELEAANESAAWEHRDTVIVVHEIDTGCIF